MLVDPNVDGLILDIDRQIADALNVLRPGIVLQLLPLPREEILNQRTIFVQKFELKLKVKVCTSSQTAE